MPKVGNDNLTDAKTSKKSENAGTRKSFKNRNRYDSMHKYSLASCVSKISVSPNCSEGMVKQLSQYVDLVGAKVEQCSKW